MNRGFILCLWSRLRRPLVAGLSLAVAATLTACTLDEIAIGLIPDGATPWFTFHYVKNSKEPVRIIELEVKASGTGKVIWRIRALNYPELRPGKYDSEVWARVQAVPVASLQFGYVPEGLEQVIPDVERRPQLEPNVKYIVSARSGIEGDMEFMLSGECRKVSLTPFSKDHPAYLVPNRCADAP